jgi:deoxyribonuclease-4
VARAPSGERAGVNQQRSKSPASPRRVESSEAQRSQPPEPQRDRISEPQRDQITERRRIGVHLSTAGGVYKAAERAHQCGANTFQIFSSSPRMWRAARLADEHCVQMRELRQRFDVSPLVIHASYLINLPSQSDEVRGKSIAAFRGEIERALALGAEFLVLHPGSWRGLTREEGVERTAAGIEQALAGLDWQGCAFRILLENTAGAEFSLGSSFDHLGALLRRLKPVAPVAVCLDTCHVHVAGYDIVSAAGYEATVLEIDRLIGLNEVCVWHMNDAKAERGSRLDRHEHIGEGTIGVGTFRRLLNDPRFAHCAFLAETPVDEPGDEERNVRVLRSLFGRPAVAG